MSNNSYKYHYAGQPLTPFVYYQLPHMLFSDGRFKNLSLSAKIIYTLMYDRISLSIKNNWIDKQGRIYIYFTIEEIANFLNCGLQKACKVMDELNNKGIGLIDTRRQGQGKPNVIYVKDFMS